MSCKISHPAAVSLLNTFARARKFVEQATLEQLDELLTLHHAETLWYQRLDKLDAAGVPAEESAELDWLYSQIRDLVDARIESLSPGEVDRADAERGEEDRTFRAIESANEPTDPRRRTQEEIFTEDFFQATTLRLKGFYKDPVRDEVSGELVGESLEPARA